MGAGTRSLLGGLARLGGSVGAIFTKESRAASRRPRYFLLRCVYLAALTVVVVLVWTEAVRFEGGEGLAYLVSRMAEAGKTIIGGIMWFQFAGCQVLAILLMSTSISEEISRGTLAPLLATPLTPFQIVAGKLLSRCGHLLVLVGISFPLLALVRVFGGVPWSYVVAGLSVCVCASLFCGALTMVFSIRLRRPQAIVPAALGAAVAFYVLLPLVLMLSCLGAFLVYLVNPFLVLLGLTHDMMNPGGGAAVVWIWWPAHCAILLAATVGLLAICAKLLKAVWGRAAPRPVEGLEWSTGALALTLPVVPRPRRPGRDQPATPPAPPEVATLPLPDSLSGLRRVVGSPVLWRELHRPIFPGGAARKAVIGIAATVVAMHYLVVLSMGAQATPAVQAAFVGTYLVAGLAWTALLAAATIAPEKESRCWPLLLTTPLTGRHILLAKLLGVLRRSTPAWVLLGGHLLVFALVGLIHPIVLVHWLVLLPGALAFIMGLGAHFSARCRRTTNALLAAVGVPVVLWLLLPVGVEMAFDAAGAYGSPVPDLIRALNPVYQAVMATTGVTGSPLPRVSVGWPVYDWGFARLGLGATTLLILAVSLAYGAAGLALARRATRNMRRHAF